MNLIQYRWVALALIMATASFLSVFIFSAGLAQAQGLPDRIVPNCSGADCNFCDLTTLVQNIINTSIFLAVLLAAGLFAWAGYLYLSNTVGDTGKVQKAHSMFQNVFIGLVIVLAAWLVVDTLMKTLTGGAFGPWNEVC